MSKFAKFLSIVGVIAGVVLLGMLVGWLGSGGLRPNTPPGPSPAGLPLSSLRPVVATPPALEPSGPRSLVGHPSEPVSTVPEAAPLDLVTNWEDKLDEILVSDAKEDEKAKKLLELFPRLPENGQVEVAQHLANLVSDQDYPALGRFLTNSALPEPVLSVLVADVLNRPNSVKLPALLEVARDTQNPKAGEAKDILQLFLEADYGADWNTWQAKVEQWLKDNPD